MAVQAEGCCFSGSQSQPRVRGSGLEKILSEFSQNIADLDTCDWERNPHAVLRMSQGQTLDKEGYTAALEIALHL